MLLEIADLIIAFTQQFLYLFIAINALAIFVLLFLSRHSLIEKLRGFDRKTVVFLLAIMVFGLFIRFTDASCFVSDGKTWEHIEYVERMLDEDFFLHRSDIDHGKGYPLFLFAIFSIFGQNVYHILNLNVLFSFFSILLVFLISEIITKNKHASLFSAFLFAVMPASIIASRYGSEHNIALFFLSAAFYCLFLYLEKHDKKIFFLSAALLAMATHFRLECTIFALIFLLMPVVLHWNQHKKKFADFSLNFLVIVLFFSQFLAFYALLPFVVGYIEDSNDPLAAWANTARHNQEESFDEKFPEFGNPGLFSIRLFPVNLSLHFEALLNQRYYLIPLLFFALFSFFGIFKYRFLPAIILWIVFFLLFFGLWWASTVTSPAMYQWILITPLTILISTGVLIVWQYFITFFSKTGISKKYLSPAFLAVILLILIQSMLVTEMNFTGMPLDREECLLWNVEELSKNIEPNSCVVASSVGRSRMNAYFIAKYSLPGLEIVPDNPFKCKNVPDSFLAHEFQGEKENLLAQCKKTNCNVLEYIHKRDFLWCKIDC